tara:strand:+ start:14712 stop:15119 length:408 start_codon:yes stop_codon:yes gene_type:complete
MINKNQIVKNDKFFLAAILMALAVVFWGATFLVYSSPKLEPDVQERRSKDVGSCSRFAEKIGYKVKSKSRSELEIITADFKEPKFTYLNVKQVALACTNMEVSSFCLGAGGTCGLPEDMPYGLRLNLVFTEPRAN